MREDWLTLSYDDVVRKISTSGYKIKQRDYQELGAIPIIDQGKEFIGGYTDDVDKILPCSLPVIIFGDHTRNVKLVTKSFVPGADGTVVLETLDAFSPYLLLFFTQYLVATFRNKGYARHYHHIKKLPIPLPPLPEQRAIVAKLERLFSELDNGIANLKSARQKLELYRQSVLKKAFEGENPEENIKLDRVVSELSQGWSPKCERRSSKDINEWAVIKTSAVQAGNFFDFENKVLPRKLEPRKQHEIRKGNILITRAGPRIRVGICCLVKKTRPKLINCDKVYRVRLKADLVSSEYFEYALNSPHLVGKIEVLKSGSNDSGLNLKQNTFLQLEIPLPPLPEQHQIVREIESRLSVADRLMEDIDRNLEKADSLRHSILKKAFAGELLTKAELEACREEPDWEPAEKLLERIKAEKKKGKSGRRAKKQ